MSIIVKGMEMPESCGLCPCFHAEHLMYCQAVKADKEKRIVAPYGIQRPSWCPLMEVPPHGRFVDLEYAKEHIRACFQNGMPMHSPELHEVLEMLDNIPTIISEE